MQKTAFIIFLIFALLFVSCDGSGIVEESKEETVSEPSSKQDGESSFPSDAESLDVPSDENSADESEESFDEPSEESEEQSEEVPDGYFYAYGEDDLASFISEKANREKTLLLKDDITLSDDLIFPFPFILDPDGHKINADPYGISFVTEEKGAFVIGGCADAIKTIYAPDCDVIITGDAPSYDYAEKYFAFASYNGICRPESLFFGGKTPEKITLDAVDGVIDGNHIRFSVPFLKKFSVSSELLEVTDEDVTDSGIVSEDGRSYIVVTDKDGGKRSFLVVAERLNNVLPVIYIDVEDGKTVVSKDEYLNCTVTVDYNSYEGSEEFDEIVSLSAGVRGRGHSSWELEKKPYKLKFEEKASLFGLTKAKKWVLQANHTDRTLFRNTLAMRMGAVLDNMPFVPHSYPVDLFVNGEYAGVYTLTEQIEIHKGRIEGEEDSTEIDTDYLIEMGEDETKTSFGSNVFHSALELFMAIKNPSEDVLTKEQYDFVRDYFNKADDAVKKGEGYEEYIDVDSLIDWFILDEFSYNLDCTFRRSGIYLKRKGGKIYLASPWDFDCAFGNFSLDNYEYTGWISLGNTKTDNYDEYIKTNWMDYLLKNDAFKKKLKERWEEVGETLYTTATETIKALGEQVSPSASCNFTVWKNVFGKKLQYESVKSRTLMTYEEQLDYLEWFIETRYNWINEEISKY